MYIPYTCMVQYIDYNVLFSYAGSESVYGGVDIEVVHVAMGAVRASSSLYQESKL